MYYKNRGYDMNIICVLDRVYINLGEGFGEQVFEMDLTVLINEVAKSVKEYEGIILYDEKEQKIFLGRTKKYIVKEVNRFIAGFEEKPALENMASYTSKRQLNRLIRILKNKKGRMSCYGLIFLHIMFVNIQDHQNCHFKTYADTMRKMVECYCQERGRTKSCNKDELIEFFLKCYKTVKEEFNNSGAGVKAKKYASDFPKIPKRNASDVYND